MSNSDKRKEQQREAQTIRRAKLEFEGKRQLNLIVSDSRRTGIKAMLKLIEDRDYDDFALIVKGGDETFRIPVFFWNKGKMEIR
jgi:hypothetical protein